MNVSSECFACPFTSAKNVSALHWAHNVLYIISRQAELIHVKLILEITVCNNLINNLSNPIFNSLKLQINTAYRIFSNPPANHKNTTSRSKNNIRRVIHTSDVTQLLRCHLMDSADYRPNFKHRQLIVNRRIARKGECNCFSMLSKNNLKVARTRCRLCFSFHPWQHTPNAQSTFQSKLPVIPSQKIMRRKSIQGRLNQTRC